MKFTCTILMLISLVMTSCCTITKQPEIISIISSPPGAHININGYDCGITPQAFEMDPKYTHDIVLEKECYAPYHYKLKSRTSPLQLSRNMIFPVLGGALGAGIGYAIFPPFPFFVFPGAMIGIGAGSAVSVMALGIDGCKGTARQFPCDHIDCQMQPLSNQEDYE